MYSRALRGEVLLLQLWIGGYSDGSAGEVGGDVFGGYGATEIDVEAEAGGTFLEEVGEGTIADDP